MQSDSPSFCPIDKALLRYPIVVPQRVAKPARSAAGIAFRYSRNVSINSAYQSVRFPSSDIYHPVVYRLDCAHDNGGMSESEVVPTRRRRLRQAIDERFDGKLVKFIDQTGINSGELSALLRNKSFGEKKARSLEEAAGLPRYFLDGEREDKPASTAPIEPITGEASHLLDLWGYLLPDERQKIMGEIEQKAAHNQRVMQELAPYGQQNGQPHDDRQVVRVADRRKRQVHFGWTERRPEKKEGEK
jgi:hypothetical protein